MLTNGPPHVSAPRPKRVRPGQRGRSLRQNAGACRGILPGLREWLAGMGSEAACGRGFWLPAVPAPHPLQANPGLWGLAKTARRKAAWQNG